MHGYLPAHAIAPRPRPAPTAGAHPIPSGGAHPAQGAGGQSGDRAHDHLPEPVLRAVGWVRVAQGVLLRVLGWCPRRRRCLSCHFTHAATTCITTPELPMRASIPPCHGPSLTPTPARTVPKAGDPNVATLPALDSPFIRQLCRCLRTGKSTTTMHDLSRWVGGAGRWGGSMASKQVDQHAQ